MSKSDIVFQMQYKTPKNKKVGITKWIDYASQKQKADDSSIDENNVLKDYAIFSDHETFLNESSETFLWNSKGDILKRDVLDSLKNMNDNGVFWRGFVSFPSEFAIDHGLITKLDFYSLTTNVMPSLIIDMGLDINNVEWLCTLHRDTGHPHIHFCIYEKVPKSKITRYPKSCIYNFKSKIANFIIDNKKFYELRDQSFSNITGKINLKEFNKVKSQRLFSDKYRRDLNKLLLELYNKLPSKGRFQYNSKSMNKYRNDLNHIIRFILLHDSVKYDYATYLRLLEQHQRELNQVYGMSSSNKDKDYYNDQLNRLFSKIGNEILDNFKRYQSIDIMDKEKQFLYKHINEMSFKSRNDYTKDSTRLDIAKGLYKICMLANFNENQTKKVINRWIKRSNYNYKIDDIWSSITTLDYEMSVSELNNYMKKLGYDYDRYNKIKEKYFYRELNYKVFIDRAINHLKYELEAERNQIVEDMQYELDNNVY